MSLFLILIVLILLLILYVALGNHVFSGKCKIAHDMSGKLIIITGSSSGLGKFTV